jgi:hypothetical protein
MGRRRERNQGLRRSQAVSTFGPGAVVDLRHISVMMGGQDFWPENAVEIHEPNLERLLHVEAFRMPSVTGDQDLPAIVYPEWLVCPKCNRLARYWYFTQGEPVETGQPIRCPRCHVRVYPARLITACEHGHADEFPWEIWVHLGRGNVTADPEPGTHTENACRRPELYLEARGFTSALADIEVWCRQCGNSRNLGGATQPENLGFLECRGKRPWLRDEVQCGAPVYPVQRGASNVYFPVQASSISIPPWSERLYAQLDRHWGLLRNIGSVGTLEALIKDNRLDEVLNMSVADVVRAVQYRRMEETREDENLTERDLRFQECQALRRGTGEGNPQTEFRATMARVPSTLAGLISRVMLVERLREVRALLGFTRVSPPDPSSRLEATLTPIAQQRMNWLPGIEVRGEGVYLELDEEAVTAWSMRVAVQGRAARLQRSYERMCHARNWHATRRITPRLILTHSLAHLLIRQLGLASGYSSAALRERLYVFDPEDETGYPTGLAGLLIYTSTPDSEGSLGGLVRQGQPQRLEETVLSALQEAAWCSSDPLCIESEGQGRDALNLAACHACMLVSETSCEEFNVFLDRGLLTGTLDAPDVGFFADLLE